MEVDTLKQVEVPSGAGNSDFSCLNSGVSRESSAEHLFLTHAKRLNVKRILDIGSNTGQFALKLRSLGFDGTIFSVEPQSQCQEMLRKNSAKDANWIILPRQGAGAHCAFLELRIAESGHSLSTMNAHSNHMNAEHKAHSADKERVFINKASQLMHHQLMSKIEAMKIDTQGIELNVLKGLSEYKDTIKLLQIELSPAECYEGAPDLLSVDSFITNELGFERLSPEPRYHDEINEVAQQYEGLYLKRTETSYTELPKSKLELGAIATSIGGIPKRVANSIDYGPNWFGSCLTSWRKCAPEVISISEMRPPEGDIKWLKTESKPTISEVLQKLNSATKKSVLLTNADILFTDAIREAFQSLDPEVFYYGRRFDVEIDPENPEDLVGKGYYSWGFDFFILPSSLLELVNDGASFPHFLRIGEPWWDYALPVFALSKGYPTKRLVTVKEPAALHLRHPIVSNKWLRQHGIDFIDWLKTIKSEAPCPISGLLEEWLSPGICEEINGHHPKLARKILFQMP